MQKTILVSRHRRSGEKTYKVILVNVREIFTNVNCFNAELVIENLLEIDAALGT